MATRVRSFSKINLGLLVGPARGDGFHALITVYQTLALHDLVTVSAKLAAKSTVRLTADHPGVPSSEHGSAERNTAWKMVTGALRRLGLTAEVEIAIEKRLPVQGGMGAGSANAVAALLGLERQLGVALPPAERLELAAEVGSDVPLFLLGGAVLGLGRGEQVSLLPDLPPLPCVVALPAIGVSTALAFKALDARDKGQGIRDRGQGRATLTSEAFVDTLKELSHALAAVKSHGKIHGNLTGSEAGPSGIAQSEHVQDIQGDLAKNPLLALVRTGIENDFEEVVFSQHPSLRSIKRDLLGSSGDGALCAALSGSGSALFGLYETRAAAEAAQQRVQASGTQAVLTETLPRQRYWDTMFAE